MDMSQLFEYTSLLVDIGLGATALALIHKLTRRVESLDTKTTNISLAVRDVEAKVDLLERAEPARRRATSSLGVVR